MAKESRRGSPSLNRARGLVTSAEGCYVSATITVCVLRTVLTLVAVRAVITAIRILVFAAGIRVVGLISRHVFPRPHSSILVAKGVAAASPAIAADLARSAPV